MGVAFCAACGESVHADTDPTTPPSQQGSAVPDTPVAPPSSADVDADSPAAPSSSADVDADSPAAPSSSADAGADSQATPTLAPTTEPEEPASGCTEWLVDDFEGNALLGAVWGVRVDPETDDLVASEVVPDPLGTDDSAQALHLALEFEEPTSVDLHTHFHGIDPRGSDALRFRARTDSETSASTSWAVTITLGDSLGDWPPPEPPLNWTASAVTLSPDWQEFTLPISDVLGIDQALTPDGEIAFHFMLLDAESVDVWLDDVALVCDE